MAGTGGLKASGMVTMSHSRSQYRSALVLAGASARSRWLGKSPSVPVRLNVPVNFSVPLRSGTGCGGWRVGAVSVARQEASVPVRLNVPVTFSVPLRSGTSWRVGDSARSLLHAWEAGTGACRLE